MKEFIRSSFPYFKKYLPVQILATLFGLMRIVILLVTPQVISLMVDRVINPLLGAESVQNGSIFLFLVEHETDPVRIFGILAATLALFAVLFFICFYLKWNLAHYFAMKSEKAMRTDALNKVNGASAPLLARYSSGDLVLITTSDARRVRSFYTENLQFTLDNLFYIVVSSVFLCKINYLLLFLPFVGGLATLFTAIAFQKKFSRLFDRMREENAALTTTVQESIYGIRTVAAFAREEEREKRFDTDNRTLMKSWLRRGDLFGVRQIATWGLRAAIFLGEVCLGIYLGYNQKITAGDFTATIGYLGMLMWQFTGLLHCFNNMQNNLVSGKRLFGFLNDRDEVAERYGNDLPSSAPALSFKNVSVKNGDVYALDRIDLELPYGKKLGVMGRTGSGKTLLLKLMQGFAEYDEGTIALDGKPLHDYDRDALARTYSYAMQNVFLFSNTIAANIALYDPYGTQEDMLRAGGLAEVDEFVSRFPEGYDTTVGEKGFGLSGGQKQRVSIARALYKNAPVLLFDDVTSALDLDTERKVMQNLEHACGEKTRVTVTHRAAALKDCDEIIFLDRGKIVERGSFEELLALNGNFAEIYKRQANEVAYAQ